MKNLILALSITIGSSFIKTNKSFDLPQTWSDDFRISLYHGGGKRYASTKVVLSADSIIYTEMEEGNDVVKKFKMSNQDREKILTELKRLKIEQVSSKKIKEIIYDKVTSELCFEIASKTKHCMESSATEEIPEKQSSSFWQTYQYLLNFAKNNAK